MKTIKPAPKIPFPIAALLFLLLAGCFSALPDCPLNKADRSYLQRHRLKLPGLHSKIISQSYQLIAGDMNETEKVYLLTEVFSHKTPKLTVTYHLYPRAERAAAAYQTLVAGFPAGSTIKKSPRGWATKTGGIYRLYTLKDRLILIQESPDEKLLNRN